MARPGRPRINKDQRPRMLSLLLAEAESEQIHDILEWLQEHLGLRSRNETLKLAIRQLYADTKRRGGRRRRVWRSTRRIPTTSELLATAPGEKTQ